ncbi:hypothetical protein C8R44DRAFT_726568 [Mycena epipterygia]|nr:hypothetical protein C8R44DRAFT_726568 [Mycena epipterygia]
MDPPTEPKSPAEVSKAVAAKDRNDGRSLSGVAKSRTKLDKDTLHRIGDGVESSRVESVVESSGGERERVRKFYPASFMFWPRNPESRRKVRISSGVESLKRRWVKSNVETGAGGVQYNRLSTRISSGVVGCWAVSGEILGWTAGTYTRKDRYSPRKIDLERVEPGKEGTPVDGCQYSRTCISVPENNTGINGTAGGACDVRIAERPFGGLNLTSYRDTVGGRRGHFRRFFQLLDSCNEQARGIIVDEEQDEGIRSALEETHIPTSSVSRARARQSKAMGQRVCGAERLELGGAELNRGVGWWWWMVKEESSGSCRVGTCQFSLEKFKFNPSSSSNLPCKRRRRD